MASDAFFGFLCDVFDELGYGASDAQAHALGIDNWASLAGFILDMNVKDETIANLIAMECSECDQESILNAVKKVRSRI